MLLYREECEKWVDHFKGCFPETIDNGVAVYNRGMVEDAALAAEVFLRIKERYPGNTERQDARSDPFVLKRDKRHA